MIDQIIPGLDNGALFLIAVLVPATIYAYVNGYFKEF